jgi:hypothetical protein
MSPLLPLIGVGALAAWAFGRGKKKEVASRPYLASSQSDFPGGATGELYGAYQAAITGHLQPIAYGVLAEDLRYHGFEFEADQVAQYAMAMGANWASLGEDRRGWSNPSTQGNGRRFPPRSVNPNRRPRL